MRSLAAFLPCFLLACSGGDFGVGGEVPDSTSEDSTAADAGDDVAADTSVTPETGADTAMEETCVKNACGGCTALVGNPGDPCPSCGGKLKCKGTDALECDSTVPKNECGGCSMLSVAKGTVCGVCNTGAYVCDGTDATKCMDPVTGPMPMSACGTCGTKKVICDAMSPGGTKCEGDDANVCGGCGMLSHSTTDHCGVCNTGTYSCDSTTKDRTKCTDPVTGKAPGTACGTCGTKKIICDATAMGGTRCEADDANECGGCTIFPSATKPGASCGACGGKYACNGKEATKCSDNNPVPLATKCGMYCNASSYVCSSGQTVCAAPDDRKDGTDTLASAKDAAMWTFNNGELYAVSFATQRLGAVTGFSIAFFRYDESSPSVDPGNVRIRLIKGTPTKSPAVSDVIATFNVPGDKIFDGGGAAYELALTLPTPTMIYPAGTQFFIEVQENSYKYNYAIAGGTPAAPSKTDWWVTVMSATGYGVYTALDPFLKVGMTGCF